MSKYYEDNFTIGIVKCPICGEKMIVKRKKRFLRNNIIKGKCKHCDYKWKTHKIKSEQVIALLIL